MDFGNAHFTYNARVCVAYVAPRLREAFKALRAQGYLARQRFMCCGGCASAAISNYVHDMNPKRAAKVQGAVFYHKQDAEALNANYMPHPLHLRYGRVHVGDGPDERTYGKENVLVGEDVQQALRDHGLNTQWDGDPARTIVVHGITQEVIDAAAAAQRLGGNPNDVLLGNNTKHRASGK